jgi:hypothetical protein
MLEPVWIIDPKYINSSAARAKETRSFLPPLTGLGTTKLQPFQGLTPLAINYRPFGTKTSSRKQLHSFSRTAKLSAIGQRLATPWELVGTKDHALKGHQNSCALSGLLAVRPLVPQGVAGVALGWILAAFQAEVASSGGNPGAIAVTYPPEFSQLLSTPPKNRQGSDLFPGFCPGPSCLAKFILSRISGGGRAWQSSPCQAQERPVFERFSATFVPCQPAFPWQGSWRKRLSNQITGRGREGGCWDQQTADLPRKSVL